MSGQIPDFKKFWTPYFFIISDIFQTFYRYTGQFPNSFGDKFWTFFFYRVEEESMFMGKTFGIITDAKELYFMECSLNDQDRLRFRLSKPVTVVYDNENMGGNIERILAHIAWKVQKLDSASQSEERAIKKPRSSGNLKEKSDTVVKS
ncbi:unnamed protein product [Rhizophagus irregularis]|nr:unnamed protein product [Rhizophagus irregularis]